MAQSPSLIHVIPHDDNRSVVGVTSIHRQLFVLRSPTEQRIQVYDVNTFVLQQHTVPVNGLSDVISCGGLTSCVTNNCLYVSDWDKDIVHKVELATGNKVSNWRVGDGPMGLSVNSACNLLVTCSAADKIQEYTSNGSLVREIRLQSSVANLFPHHAIQLTGGHLAVSYWNYKDKFVNSMFVGNRENDVDYSNDDKYDVGEIDNQGRIVVSCKNKLSPRSRLQFRSPTHLAFDRNNDCIFVVDSGNRQIVILDRSFSCLGEINLPIDGVLNKPICLHFDESCGRLYVGENDNSRVLVYNNFFNIPTNSNKLH
jgi:hypothetical protein